MVNSSNIIGENGAIFNEDRTKRFLLWRSRPEGDGVITFIMLNPSTADEVKNDPSVLRCWTRAQKMGFRVMFVCNLFSIRSTDPKGIVPDEGDDYHENFSTIIRAVRRSNMIVCAWGNHGDINTLGHQILGNLRRLEYPVFVFGITKANQPKHPLYIGYDVEPKPIDWKSLKLRTGGIIFNDLKED